MPATTPGLPKTGPSARAAKPAGARKKTGRRRRGWKFYALLATAVPLAALAAVSGYYYVTFSRLIDARLHGEMQRADPRVFARPFSIKRGQALTVQQMIDRLNDLGYARKERAQKAGEFTVGRDAILMVPRSGDRSGQIVRASFGPRSAKGGDPARIERLEVPATKETFDRLTIDAPLITALVTTAREKRRDVPLSNIPQRMIHAVLAIEDRRFYEHAGVDPIAIGASFFEYMLGRRAQMRGGSTLTQQIVKNMFLTQERSPVRKYQEWIMSIALERRLTKDQVLEFYLNDVWLGQRGSFAIHGVPEAARLFFAKDISNVTLAEAATIAGVIQSPPRHSPFNYPERSRERRNVVLRTMAEVGFISTEAADRAVREPLRTAARSLEAEAPYFVDFVTQELEDQFQTSVTGSVDVYTTLDLHLQRIAQDALREGLTRVDEILAKRKRQRAQAALIAVDPRTGEILALVGGRSYNQSQYNRAINARRQPGSVFKPFVYLAAFERAAAEWRTDITPAMVVMDEPTTFMSNEKAWDPRNYDGEYEGAITLRRALALSRNIATVKVAEAVGYGEVAALWRRVGAGTPPRPYPSIALGVFEATPLEIAAAYTLFPNGGTIRPLRAISRLVTGGKDVDVPAVATRTIARRDTTYLVTNMMRSVINEGTGAGARAAGFALDAAGKSGTTNDLRDAWFVGFTPELLTVVWVGLDDNQPLGLSGTQAALPIWTTFMMRSLAGHANVAFDAPEGVVFVDIDRDTGALATSACPRVFREAFLDGTTPYEVCRLHSF